MCGSQLQERKSKSLKMDEKNTRETSFTVVSTVAGSAAATKCMSQWCGARGGAAVLACIPRRHPPCTRQLSTGSVRSCVYQTSQARTRRTENLLNFWALVVCYFNRSRNHTHTCTLQQQPTIATRPQSYEESAREREIEWVRLRDRERGEREKERSIHAH